MSSAGALSNVPLVGRESSANSGDLRVTKAVVGGKAVWLLTVLFLFKFSLVNPWVRGDGVGYYAYVRALLVEHKLDCQNYWR